MRVWREHRGMTSIELADKISIDLASLSEIETGGKDGSLAVMERVAEALGVTLGDVRIGQKPATKKLRPS